MTFLGKYLNEKSINKAEVSRKTGIRKSRLSQLSNDEKSNFKAKELYLISRQQTQIRMNFWKKFMDI